MINTIFRVFFLKNIFSFLRYLDPITDKTCRYLNLKKKLVCVFIFILKKCAKRVRQSFFFLIQVNHLKYKFWFNCVSVWRKYRPSFIDRCYKIRCLIMRSWYGTIIINSKGYYTKKTHTNYINFLNGVHIKFGHCFHSSTAVN